MIKFETLKKVNTLSSITEEIKKVVLIKDENLVKALFASVVGNFLGGDQVWMLLVAPPSGSKTLMLSLLEKINNEEDKKTGKIFYVSDLTLNTFASGLNTGKGNDDPSLLMKASNGLIIFKDFTSIMSKEQTVRDGIMAQLREIYDGKFVKMTGNNKNIEWNSQVGIIGGVTEAVYMYMAQMSSLGERFMFYNIEQPNRHDVLRRTMENGFHMKEYIDTLQDFTKQYIESVNDFVNKYYVNLFSEGIKFTEQVFNELMYTADLAAIARSAVFTDYKTGEINFVPAPEMPSRIFGQLKTMAAAIAIMKLHDKYHTDNVEPNENTILEIDQEDIELLKKFAFDSIPKTRRNVLVPLAEYSDGVTTKGLAIALNLPSDTVKRYLYQLNGLKVCDRREKRGPGGDQWILKEDFRKVILNVADATIKEGMLDISELAEQDDDDLVGEVMGNNTIDESELMKDFDEL